MPKDPKDFIDWNVTPQIIPDAGKPLSKNEKGKGEQALVNQFAALVRKTINVPDPGPTRRQVRPEEEREVLLKMFPNLAKDEAELQKREEEWGNTFNNFFDEVRKPIEQQKPEGLKKSDWGSRGAVKEDMTEEEKRANMTEEEWKIHNIKVTPDSESGIE